MNSDIDLAAAVDNYCSTCKKKKEKYIGSILGTPAVLYRDSCNCALRLRSTKRGKSDKQIFDELQTPFWKILGLKPTEKERRLESYLKSKGMTYGDFRRLRDYQEGASNQSAMKQFHKHNNQYGTRNAPTPSFSKISR